MARLTPIDALIDKAGMRCTICAARMGECDCWTRRDGRDADDAWLILSCPECGRFMAVERIWDIDPARATLMVLPCDEPCNGDGATPGYYDASGRELGPDDWPEACR